MGLKESHSRNIDSNINVMSQISIFNTNFDFLSRFLNPFTAVSSNESVGLREYLTPSIQRIILGMLGEESGCFNQLVKLMEVSYRKQKSGRIELERLFLSATASDANGSMKARGFSDWILSPQKRVTN
jgi:hypothetical protein